MHYRSRSRGLWHKGATSGQIQTVVEIRVERDAQKTNAYQECRNLMLSPTAHAVPIPGLEILANDVRCTHAAAIAQVDKDQIFYLRSRGIGEPEARALGIEYIGVGRSSGPVRTN